VIAGTKYARAVEIESCGAAYGVSISAQKLPGYRAISFVLGLEDQNVVGTTMNFVVAADGNQVYKKLVRQGSLSTVEIPLGKAQVLSLSAIEVTGGSCAELLLANPVALPSGALPAAPPSGPAAKSACSSSPPPLPPVGNRSRS